MKMVLNRSAKVAVVGAGLAGLTAAWRLAQTGLDVVVYEARERVGGRAETITEGFAGQHADLGPELVADSYRALPRLCADLGVELSEPVCYHRPDAGTDTPALLACLEEGRLIIGGQLVDAPRRAAIEAELSAAMESTPAAPHEVLGQWARRARLTDAARGALSGIARMLTQADLNQLDGHFVFSSGLGAARRIVGGTQRLPEALAEDLDVRLGTAVRTIHHGGGAIQVTTEHGDAARFDRVIATAPFHVLATIGFAPPLDPGRLAALNAFQAAVGGKVVAQFAEGDAVRAALSRACFTDTAINTLWVSNPYVTEGPAVVTGFACGSDRALLESPETAAGKLQELVEMTVGSRVTLLRSFTKDWTSDRWALAVTTTPGTSQRGDIVARAARPYGRVHFAGDYTDFGWSGTMEGAVRSGHRAADEVIRRPSRIPLAEIDSRLVRS